MIFYLHDIKKVVGTEVGANFGNLTLLENLERTLDKLTQQGVPFSLTADDGYKSVFNLLPLLERYNVNLTLFITTGFTSGDVYPYEVVFSDLLASEDLIQLENLEIPCLTREEKNNTFGLVHKRFKELSKTNREKELWQLLASNNTRMSELKKDIYLSWDEVRDISKHSRVEIGSHCISHTFLPSQSTFHVFKELFVSKRILERKLGLKIDKVSYPYGGTSRKVIYLASFCGYNEGYGTHSKTNSGRLNKPRVDFNQFYNSKNKTS